MKNPKMNSMKNQKNEYAKASEHIKSAIEILGTKAKSGDAHAKEVIANLSVVLFDIK